MSYDFIAASSQRLNIASNPAGISTSLMTISAWVQLDITTKCCIAGTGTASYLNQQNYIGYDGAGSFIAATDLNGEWAAGGGGPSYAGWYHICGVYSATNARYIYVGGALAGSNTTIVSSAIFTNVYVGACATPNRYWDGRIAEVGFWNVALGSAEILALSKGYPPNVVRPGSLKYYLPLLRTIQENKSGLVFSNHGTALAYAAHPPMRRPVNPQFTLGGASKIRKVVFSMHQNGLYVGSRG